MSWSVSLHNTVFLNIIIITGSLRKVMTNDDAESNIISVVTIVILGTTSTYVYNLDLALGVYHL